MVDAVKTRIYIIEEQETYQQMYRSVFSPDCEFQLLGISSEGPLEKVPRALIASQPDILVVGLKKLTAAVLADIESVRLEHPRLGVVLLMAVISSEDFVPLRRILQNGKAGMALYLKPSLDSMRQLHSMLLAVGHGQVILDPAIASTLFIEKAESAFLKDLTDRELEIVGLLARGYTNYAISVALYIDVKTVAHHLNSIYSKLKESTDFNDKHPRVNVARLYLETTGELVPDAARAIPLAEMGK